MQSESHPNQNRYSGDISLPNAHAGELQRVLSTRYVNKYPELRFSTDGDTLINERSGAIVLLWDMNRLPELIPQDLNFDGVVHVEDLIVVSNFGDVITDVVFPSADLNGDGAVDRQDGLQPMAFLVTAAGAPSAALQTISPGLTGDALQRWIDEAHRLKTRM